MRALGRFLAERTVVELTAAVAIALGIWGVCSQFAYVLLQAIPVQRADSPGFSYIVNLGHHAIYLLNVLADLIGLGLVLGISWVVVRILRLTTWSDDELRDCPHCLADIPTRASVCQFCTRDVATAS